MNTKKGTMNIFKFDYEIFSVMVEERFKESITKRDVWDIVNRSYGIIYNSKINLNKYSNELARHAKLLNDDENILYTFFDITLGIITKKVINNDDANKILDEMIFERMCELTGNIKK